MHTNDQTIADLIRARALLARPGGWCQRTAARTAEGFAADTFGDAAVSFCIAGAISRVIGDRLTMQSEYLRYSRAVIALGFEPLVHDPLTPWGSNHTATAPYWNDQPERTQGEVLARFDEAIVRLFMIPETAVTAPEPAAKAPKPATTPVIWQSFPGDETPVSLVMTSPMFPVLDADFDDTPAPPVAVMEPA